MDSTSPLYPWLYRVLFFLIAAVVLLIHLLPLETLPSRFPAPDILAPLTFAWILRRPEFVPMLLIGAIFLLADMFFMRPPGLWAALAVIGAEILRSRGLTFREMPFSFEWMLVAIVMVGMAAANQIILAIFLVDPPSFGLSIIQLLFTILIYPVVVVLSRTLFKVRRLTPGELDPVVRRL